MHRTKLQRGVVITAAALALTSTACFAQFTSRAQTIHLIAIMREPLTVDVMDKATIDLKAANSTTTGGGVSTLQTSWTLAPGRPQVRIWAWVSNGSAALTDDAGHVVPASALMATASGSGSPGGSLNVSGSGIPSFRPGARGVQIGDVPITNTNVAGSSTTTVTWKVNDNEAQLLSGASYAGTVNLQIEVEP